MEHQNMELTLTRGPQEPTHFHPELELCFVVEGSAEVTHGQERCVLGREDVLLFNSGVTHSLYTQPDAIVFQIRYSCQHVSALLGTGSAVFQCNSVADRTLPYGELRKLLREAVFQYVQQDRRTDCLKRSALYRVLDCLTEHYLVQRSDDLADNLNDDEKLQQVFQYVSQSYQYGISLTEAAEQLYLSPSTLSRFFKKQTGVYFADYVTHIRMNHAVQELLQTDKGITAIAVGCGFSSASVFNHNFKEVYGVSPTDYRKEKREAERIREQEERAREERLRQELRASLAEQSVPVAGKVSVRVDAQKRHPLEKRWSSVLNVGSFDNLTQAHPQRQVLLLKEKLGFHYARIWSIFSPKMNLTSGVLGAHQNYSRVDSVLDFLVENGLTPFLDFANRPDIAFGELDVSVFQRLDYIPFESRAAWEECLRKLFDHLLNRYGREEVERWRFEFSYNRQHSPQSDFYQGEFDYFEAFRAAWHIIREALPGAEVGGPMCSVSSDEDFVQDFLLSCRRENCLPVFVSFMLFPYYTTREGDHWQNELAASENVELDYTAAMKDLLQRTGCTGCKLYVTEWNNTVSSRNYLNDSAFRGAYFVRKLPELAERVDLICPWLATDLISSYYDVKGLANGSPGMLTRDSIPKPALYALQFLNALDGNLVERGSGYIVTSKESGSFYILCTNFKWYGCNYFLKRELLDEPTEVEHIFEDEDLMELSLTLEHLPRDCFYLVTERSISPQEGAVLGEWKKFQYEENLSASNLHYLREVCTPKRNLSRKKAVGGCLQLELVLHPHEVRLIHTQRETERPR